MARCADATLKRPEQQPLSGKGCNKILRSDHCPQLHGFKFGPFEEHRFRAICTPCAASAEQIHVLWGVGENWVGDVSLVTKTIHHRGKFSFNSLTTSSAAPQDCWYPAELMGLNQRTSYETLLLTQIRKHGQLNSSLCLQKNPAAWGPGHPCLAQRQIEPQPVVPPHGQAGVPHCGHVCV